MHLIIVFLLSIVYTDLSDKSSELIHSSRNLLVHVKRIAYVVWTVVAG